MSASDDAPRRRKKVSRRSFLVMAGGLTLGSFALPPLGSAPAAKTRRLVGPPTRWGEDDESLLWTELDAAGEAHVMMWTPASKAEARDLEAFYRAATQVDWDSVVVADVPKPGDDDDVVDESEAPRGPRPRRFEFRSSNSAKFWEILRDGDSYTVTFGQIGTRGSRGRSGSIRANRPTPPSGPSAPSAWRTRPSSSSSPRSWPKGTSRSAASRPWPGATGAGPRSGNGSARRSTSGPPGGASPGRNRPRRRWTPSRPPATSSCRRATAPSFGSSAPAT